MNETFPLLYLALFRGGDGEAVESNSISNGSVVVVMLARFNVLQTQLVWQASLCWERKVKMAFSPWSQ